ncbi:glycosidase [gut metagenome]|uniref:Glycosidase n=1 Tax=gut metagenome TaxID=749906 RepID=J9H1P9_9ZZZZ
MEKNNKIIIYQVFTRLFGNDNTHRIPNGSIEENGCGKLADFTLKALNEIKKLGATHIWYTGIIEHATQTDYRRYNIQPDHPAVVKGKAGSPYAIKDYYDVDPDLAKDIPGRMKEFENLVQRTHHSGLKVIIDFVPNHVARQYHSDAQPDGTMQLGGNDDSTQAFSPENNFYYIPQTELKGQFDMKGTAAEPYREMPAKATGNNRFDAYPNINDWYETVKLNYGVDYLNGGTCHFDPIPDTWQKMVDILLFWAGKGIDAFRCDMAEMVPVEFWEWAIPQVKAAYPDLLFIAEVYNPAEYRNYLFRGHFDYLYDKVGLYDTLRNIICHHTSATEISHAWQNLGGIEKHMLNFLENHDEQRIASEFFAGNPRKAIPALVVSACMNTNPMMIYFGQEFGEPGMDNEGFSGRDGRTTIFDYWCVDTIRNWRNGGKFDGGMLTEEQKSLYNLYQRILTLCNSEKAITQGEFFDLTYANLNGWRYNEHRQYAFLRKYADELLLIVVNFDSVAADIAINIPAHAFNVLQMPQLESYTATDLISGKKKQSVCYLMKLPMSI